LALDGRRRSSRNWVLIAVVAIFVVVPVIWLFLQTLGGTSS
jgi:succinate dehydrogenase hydrophobic anchor subunit